MNQCSFDSIQACAVRLENCCTCQMGPEGCCTCRV